MKLIFEHIKDREWDWFNQRRRGDVKWEILGYGLFFIDTRFTAKISRPLRFSLADLLANASFCKAVWGEKVFEIEMDGTRPILKPDYHTIAFKTLTLEGEEDCIEYINKTMI